MYMTTLEHNGPQAAAADTAAEATQVQIKSPARLRAYLIVKRCFDFTVALLGCILFFVPMVLLRSQILF